MRRRAFLGLCGVGVAALVSPPAFAGGGGITVGLTATIFPGLSDAMLATAAKPFRSLLEEATGTKGTVLQGGTPKELAGKLEDGEVQLGVFQGIEFAYARQSNAKLEPIVICVNKVRTLEALYIVSATFKGTNPSDLKKTTLSVPAETREHCKAFARHHCAPATPKEFFETLATAGDAEEALDEVADGGATAALVDGQAWAAFKKSKPGRAKKLRVLLASEPFPVSVVACQSGKFSATQLSRFREGLIAAKDTARGKKMLEFLRLTGFEAAPDDYERQLTAVAKAYPQR